MLKYATLLIVHQADRQTNSFLSFFGRLEKKNESRGTKHDTILVGCEGDGATLFGRSGFWDTFWLPLASSSARHRRCYSHIDIARSLGTLGFLLFQWHLGFGS